MANCQDLLGFAGSVSIRKVKELLTSDFTPVRMIELEIGQPLPTVLPYDEKTGQHYRRARCMVRLHTRPLGIVELPLESKEWSSHELAVHLWRALENQIIAHLREDGLPAVSELTEAGLPTLTMPHCLEMRERFLIEAPFVSVIVPTRNRPERIQTCLRSLLSLHYPQYEIIVVDNAPSTTATADFIQQIYHDVPQVRYLREDRQGGSWARNCGLMAARGEILAFADDDVVVDSYWLAELVRGFGHADDVACVTGLIMPLELETPAQLCIEEFGGHGKGFTRHIFDNLKRHVHLYKAGLFGAGANMAFTAAFLRSVSGFDPALGPGSLACSAEETAAFFQVIMRGYKLVYEPSALVYHQHHRDYAALRNQIYSYGVGFPAYLMKSIWENPQLLFDLVTKVPYDLLLTLISRSSLKSENSKPYLRELTMLQRRGMLHGFPAYIRSRWAMRHMQKALVPMNTHIALPENQQTGGE